MEKAVPDASLLSSYTEGYRDLFHDSRIYAGFQTTLTGILASGSTRIRQIARAAPQTGCTPHAERRLRRLVGGQNKRATVKADALQKRLRTLGAQRLAKQDEVVVILDGSDLRKPHSKKLEHLSTVRALDGDLVPGYPTLNAPGLAADGTRALLYHTTYSHDMPGYTSDNAIVHQAVRAIVKALRQAGVLRIIFVLDRGFDDLNLIRLLARLDVRFVIRARHETRKVRVWPTSEDLSLLDAVAAQGVQDSFEMRRPTSREGKTKFKLTPAVTRQREVFVDQGRVRLSIVKLDFAVPLKALEEQGWVLLTNLPSAIEGGSGRVVRLYLRRWAVEDVFSWTKAALGWEEARVLSFAAFRTLVAFAWIAAAFVFSLGSSLDSPELQLLAHLGGHVPHKNRLPGKRVLLRGLERLAAALLVEQHGRDSEVRQRLRSLSGVLFGPH